MEEKKSKKKRNIVIAGLGALVAIYFAFLDVTWLPRLVSRLAYNYKQTHVLEDVAGDGMQAQKEISEEVDAFLREKQGGFGYDAYTAQYMLTQKEEGYDVEVNILLEAEWEEVKLQEFGEEICLWSECLTREGATVENVWPNFVVKLQGNEQFWFAGSGSEGAVQEIVYAD